MASQVQIVNKAMTLLGEGRITSIDDNVKAAREAKAVWDITRDGLLASHDWTFAIVRRELEVLDDAPLNEFDYQYQIPTGCLRLIMIGDHYVGANLSDYRTGPADEYSIEGDRVLTNISAPLKVKYVSRITDTTKFSPSFVEAMAAKLASELAEPLTQSGGKRDRAEAKLRQELSNAVRVNAIQVPPRPVADSEWILARR